MWHVADVEKQMRIDLRKGGYPAQVQRELSLLLKASHEVRRRSRHPAQKLRDSDSMELDENV